MYNPPAFREARPDILLALMRAPRLATLVSNGAAGVPEVSHLPLLTDGTRVLGHLARANGHWQALREAGRALAIFHGAEGYVSPSSYPSKAEHHRVVPTWNYEAVHAEGPVELVEDASVLRRLVEELTQHHEAGRAEPWRVADAPPEFLAGQLRGIVGVVLTVERLEGKRKLSQNRAEADRLGAESDAAAALAAAMRAVREGR